MASWIHADAKVGGDTGCVKKDELQLINIQLQNTDPSCLHIADILFANLCHMRSFFNSSSLSEHQGLRLRSVCCRVIAESV